MERRGDLYRYSYDGGAAGRELIATCGSSVMLGGTMHIQAKQGYVSNTTYLGCSAGLGHGAASGSGILGLMLGLWLLRRSRYSISLKMVTPEPPLSARSLATVSVRQKAE